jgi:hypothetical protein
VEGFPRTQDLQVLKLEQSSANLDDCHPRAMYAHSIRKIFMVLACSLGSWFPHFCFQYLWFLSGGDGVETMEEGMKMKCVAS